MKVTIRGNNPITADEVKTVIETLNEEYAPLGLQVKNMTMYIRFVDESGNICEPTISGNKIERTFTFNRTKDVSK